VIATGAGYEGVRHGAFHHRLGGTAVTAKAQLAVEKPPGATAAVIPAVQEASRDEKPFRRPAVKARNEQRRQVARGVALGQAKPKPAKEVSVLPPSRVRGHDLKPTHVKKPPNVKKPTPHVKKPPPVNKGPTGEHGPSGGRGPTGEHGNSGR
jgi:hypothetical protein